MRVEAGRVSRGDTVSEPEELVGGEGAVGAFYIDASEVTNRQFAEFVEETRYVTLAERLSPEGRRFGAAVFDRATGVWRVDSNANWRHPAGIGSDIDGGDTLPVVAVAFEDAEAYARWRGRRLPSELEWESAARGAGPASPDAYEEAIGAAGEPIANIWQGIFPFRDLGEDGYSGLAPVGCFPPNAVGAYDMVGNVWEWTSDWFAVDFVPVSAMEARAADPEGLGKRVIKGGSNLCARNFCSRFRTGSRQPADPRLGMSHIGFRTVVSAP